MSWTPLQSYFGTACSSTFTSQPFSLNKNLQTLLHYWIDYIIINRLYYYFAKYSSHTNYIGLDNWKDLQEQNIYPQNIFLNV